LSPSKADPFVGHCSWPESLDLKRSRVYLEMSAPAPEAAARVTINGYDAGGVIGAPFRLEVARFLRPGKNTVRIEPFAPAEARLIVASP
jgi:hypothetical protein